MAVAFRDWGAVFKAADKDKDGVVDFGQLRDAMSNYGYSGSDQQLKDMFHKDGEKNEDIRVSRVEFTKAMNEQPDSFHVCLMLRKACPGGPKSVLSTQQLEGLVQELDSVMAPEQEVARLRRCTEKCPGGASINAFIHEYLSMGQD